MCDVYLASTRGPAITRRLVVIKTLRDGLADDPEIARMFLDEARLSTRLAHGNIVTTYEVGAHRHGHFLVMEYLEGQSLSRVRRMAEGMGEKIAPQVWAMVVADALAGLHHAHELQNYDGTPLGIVHRDVSPQNIFVTYAGQVKLIDFGIAKAQGNSTETLAGTIKGKIGYMAPEQALGNPVDRRTDIYSMGCVLWELVAGERLIKGDPSQALRRVLSGGVPRLSEVVQGVDPLLDAIVSRALERDPLDRYATARDMREALEAYVASTGARVRLEDLGRRMAEWFAQRRRELAEQVKTHMARATDPEATDKMPAVPEDYEPPPPPPLSRTVTMAPPRELIRQSRDFGERPPRKPWGIVAVVLAIVLAFAVSSYVLYRVGKALSTHPRASVTSACTAACALSLSTLALASPAKG
jgi:serine/threonine-protein kinase